MAQKKQQYEEYITRDRYGNRVMAQCNNDVCIITYYDSQKNPVKAEVESRPKKKRR